MRPRPHALGPHVPWSRTLHLTWTLHRSYTHSCSFGVHASLALSNATGGSWGWWWVRERRSGGRRRLYSALVTSACSLETKRKALDAPAAPPVRTDFCFFLASERRARSLAGLCVRVAVWCSPFRERRSSGRRLRKRCSVSARTDQRERHNRRTEDRRFNWRDARLFGPRPAPGGGRGPLIH